MPIPLLWASVHWSNVHWNATGIPLVDPKYTGIPLEIQRILARYTGTPLEKLSLNNSSLGCNWRNSKFCRLHWNTTGGTLTAPTHTQAEIVKQSSIHVSFKWQDSGTPINQFTCLCKFGLYSEFTALQWISFLLLTHVSTSKSLCACLWYEHHYSLCDFGNACQMKYI